MIEMIKLPSGAELRITLAPFADSKALYQAMLEEMKVLKIDPSAQIENLVKDIFCIGLSSQKVEAALKVCLARATYNKIRIDENTFEPEEARQDYIPLCFNVATENIRPFMKSLYAEFSRIKGMLEKVQA